MGVHHYKLSVMPASACQTHSEVFSRNDLSPDAFDELDIWQTPPANAFLTELREFLPRETSWGPCEEFESATETWGSDLRIWHHDDSRQAVRSIDFRFSGADGFPLLASFLDMVDRHDCNLFSLLTGALLEPDYDAVVADFITTRAAKFMVDPKSTIIDAKITQKKPVLEVTTNE